MKGKSGRFEVIVFCANDLYLLEVELQGESKETQFVHYFFKSTTEWPETRVER